MHVASGRKDDGYPTIAATFRLELKYASRDGSVDNKPTICIENQHPPLLMCQRHSLECSRRHQR